MSRVLYVTYDGLLEPLGESQVVPYVSGLARRGFAMSVLSWEKPGDLRDRARVETMGRELASLGVEWLHRRYHRTPSLPATAWDVLTGARAARRAASDEGGAAWSLIHARSYVAGAAGLLLSAHRGAGGVAGPRLLLDARGFLVDERVEGGVWRPGSLPVRLTRRLEHRLLRDADAVTMLTEAGRNALRAEYPLPPDTPVEVVPTCVDLDRFRPADDPAAARARLGLPDAPVVVYAGSLGTWYLPELTVAIGRAFARLTGGHFVILTREEELARRLAGPDAPEVTVRSVPHHDVPDWLRACDAGLAPVIATPSKRASAPTKVGEYLASGLAVAVTAGVGDLDAQLAGSPAGFTFDPDDAPEAIAERLVEVSRRPDRRAEARSLAERHYALEDGVEAYARIYRSLGVEPSTP